MDATRRQRIFRRLRRIAICVALTVAIAAALFFVASWLFPFPVERLDRFAVSPVVTDRHGQLLARRVGEDDHYRIPVKLEDVSPWVRQATIAVEDERFEHHLGVDPLAVARAIGQNVAAGEVVSGASTLTMQVCRMMDDRPRTFAAKAVESFRALQLERIRSKEEILAVYLNIAPYGGNVRGVEAASNLYFAKRARDLSLGEAALLAGLPQSPSRYRPDVYPDRAAQRRRTVLNRMMELGMIDAAQHRRALEEPVNVRALPPTVVAPHWVDFVLNRRSEGGRTTLDAAVQRQAARLVDEHRRGVPRDVDIAVVVIDAASGEVRALVGSADYDDDADGQVNGATAKRSPGSALKPFIYAAAFEARRLAPQSTVYDIPIQRGGWSPENFDKTFHGELPADEALRRSLNVPAILVAEGVGLSRCVGVLEAAGVPMPADAARRGGLALATGAIETSLLDLTHAYATLARRGRRLAGRTFADDAAVTPPATRALDPLVCDAINDILSTRHRRPNGLEQLPDAAVPWFMWKTGTSSGRRDAWAVGHNGRYAAGVWVGRFNGRPMPELVGAQAAEPLLARLFTLAELRHGDPPPAPPQTWVVANPLPEPRELAAGPRIVSPANDAAYLALDGQAVVHAAATARGPVTWFLNGRHLPAPPDRLTLAPGRYELRCVMPDGQADAVRFVVR